MKTIELAQATESLAEYTNHLQGDPVVVTVDGQPVAALIALDGADLESVALSTNPRFLALIAHSRARQQAEGGISSVELRRRLQLEGP